MAAIEDLSPTRRRSDQVIAAVAREAGGLLGIETVNIAADGDATAALMRTQTGLFQALLDHAGRMSASNDKLAGAADIVTSAAASEPHLP